MNTEKPPSSRVTDLGELVGLREEGLIRQARAKRHDVGRGCVDQVTYQVVGTEDKGIADRVKKRQKSQQG